MVASGIESNSFLTPTSVSCGSAASCVTVASDTGCGDSGCVSSYEVQRWDGRKWRLQRIRTSSAWADYSLDGVSCAGARRVHDGR